MKIGIITLHRTTNYGATLQSYSLFNFLKNSGHDVELIDYFSDRLKKAQFKHLFHNKFFAFNAVKSWKTNRFLSSNTKMSRNTYSSVSDMREVGTDYDVIICGSDEIWNFKSSLLGLDDAFFLRFPCKPATKKISYAASFGSTTDLGESKTQILDSLKDFSKISVRDSNSLNLVSKDCGLPAIKVVDPTFLSDYSDILRRPKIKQDYVLVYGGLSPKEREYVKHFADSKGLITIAVGYPCKTANINRLDVGPEEWLGFFSCAKYVFTNFYHGVIFSLIFDKPFSALNRPSKSVKVKDLLGDLGLEDRILTESTFPPLKSSQLFEITYDKNILKEMIGKSKMYLKESIEHS